MGWGMTPVVGPKDGDICEACEHTDCAAWRRTIAQRCPQCGQPIGAGSKVYVTGIGDPPDRFYVHAGCASTN